MSILYSGDLLKHRSTHASPNIPIQRETFRSFIINIFHIVRFYFT